MHYLALTFSTLLSSQVSGAHRTGFLCPAWGSDPHYEVWQVRVKLGPLVSHPQAISPRFRCASLEDTSVRTVRRPVDFPPGRPLQIIRSYASRTPLRPHILYACAAKRSNQLRLRLARTNLGGSPSHCRSPTRRSAPTKPHLFPSRLHHDLRASRPQRPVTVTAPTVRLPRRTMAKRPCNRSAGVRTASASSARALFR